MRKHNWWNNCIVLMLLSLAVLCGSCGTSENTRDTTGGGSLPTAGNGDPVGTPLPEVVAVDIAPVHDVTVVDIMLTGFASVHSYYVSYTRSDGNLVVPAPYIIFLTNAEPMTDGQDAVLLQEVLLLRREALLEEPFASMDASTAPLELVAHLEFFGRDAAGNEISTQAVVHLNCTDS